MIPHQPKAIDRTLECHQIARDLNCTFDGIQLGHGKFPSLFQFTDNVTGSTTYGNSYEEVREKLEVMRNKFGGQG